MILPLAAIASALGAPATAAAPATLPLRAGLSTRARCAPGDLFFALSGPNHDGHDYVPTAIEKGAVAVVVERPVPVRRMQVPWWSPDALAALQNLAAWARRHWGGRIVGVTGSAGKTTTKDAIAHLLAAELPVGKTIGNFNNHVGVPLSILRLPDEARVGVLEMGMNHAAKFVRWRSSPPRISG